MKITAIRLNSRNAARATAAKACEAAIVNAFEAFNEARSNAWKVYEESIAHGAWKVIKKQKEKA